MLKQARTLTNPTFFWYRSCQYNVNMAIDPSVVGDNKTFLYFKDN